MYLRRACSVVAAAALATTLVAPAASASPSSSTAPTGTRSLAAVLTADGDTFDRNWYDYDILGDRIEQPRPGMTQAPTARHGRRRWAPAAWAGGAAAAGIAIGLLAGYATWNEPAPPAPLEVASTQLDTLDTQQWQGMATLVREDDDTELLSVDTQRLDAGTGYLEVWLIDEGYVIVDISREGFDDKPEHSGDSLARGTLSS